MNSTLIMKILVFEYAICALVSAFELNWARSGYWFGAVILNVSLLWGMK